MSRTAFVVRPVSGPVGLPLEGAEFRLVQVAVLASPFVALRHPDLLLTLSDVLFGLSLLLRVAAGRVPLRPLGAGTGLWLAGMMFLVGGLMLASLLRGDPERGVLVSVQYAFATIALPMAVLGRSPADTMRLLRTAILSIVLVSASGILVYATGFRFGLEGPQFDFVAGNGRLSSFVGDANTLAGLIALTIPVIFYVTARGALGLPAILATVAVLATTVVLASSNSGLLACLAAIGVLLLRARLATLGAIAVGVACVAALAGWWGGEVVPAIFAKRVLSAIDAGDLSQAGTFQARWALLVEAWQMAGDTLLLGLGADQFRVLSTHGAPVHNLPMLLLVEGGIWSLAGWILLLAAVLVAPHRMSRRPGGGPEFVIAAATVTVMALLAMTFPHMYARFLVLPLLLAVAPAVTVPGRARLSMTPT